MDSLGKVIPFKLRDREYNFQDFGKAVMENNLKIATRVLRDIFQIDYKPAERSAEFVITTSKTHPAVLREIIGIRFLIQDDKKNEALLLIQKIFNISGIDSIKAYEGMRRVLFKTSKVSK